MLKTLGNIALTLFILVIIGAVITVIPMLAVVFSGLAAVAGLAVLGVVIYGGIATESFSTIDDNEEPKE